jgi:acyl-lipid omega-6 desaturase (Delta-12 desaturase)
MNQNFSRFDHPEFDLKAAARRIHRHCMGYKGAVLKRSAFQILNTVPFFLALCVVIGLLTTHYYWLSWLLVLPASGFLLRIFIIQHDCGHGSFMPTRRGNDAIGALLSVFTFTPYEHWKRNHAAHHGVSGNLDKRGEGDINTLTVAEYTALSKFDQLIYRIYRNLILQIIIGAPFKFIVLQRLPSIYAFKDRHAWTSVMLLNLSMFAFYGFLMWFFGVVLILKIFLPVVILAAQIGGWLFYVQHQFEDSVWDKDPNWDFHVSALMGSSHYDLPKIVQWFTGNIGLHHIHHLCAGIPNYRLEECLKSNSELQQIGTKIGFLESLKSIPLVLWHEGERRMISFRDYRLLS